MRNGIKRLYFCVAIVGGTFFIAKFGLVRIHHAERFSAFQIWLWNFLDEIPLALSVR